MLKYLRLLFFLLFLFGILTGITSSFCADAAFPKISIHGDKIYAGNEELLLVSVGYEHLRPGQGFEDPVPYKNYGYDLIDQDMKRIKEAGFNSIRTWDLPDEKYLELAQKYGLWVVGGIWTDQRINLSHKEEVESQIQKVKSMAKTYAKHPNVAMLLILNEPDFTLLAGANPQKLKNYFDRMVAAAHASFPGVPVSFSNWSNAAFIDSSSWDIISYNMYAIIPRFQNSIGYRGYIEGIKKVKSIGKPFYISEYGYYTPTPHLDPNDLFSNFFVDSDKKQADYLLRDMDTLYQLPIAGGALMSWLDNWDLAASFSSPLIKRPQGWIDKDVHDNDSVEWAGVLGMDTDVKGVARPALTVISRANQLILTQPDPEVIYSGTAPISIYIGDRVKRVSLVIDGTEIKNISKTSPHWVRYEYMEKEKELKKHFIKIIAFDHSNQLIDEVERSFWTAEDNRLPQLTISQIKNEQNAVYFIFILKDEKGRPIPDAEIKWDFFDAYSWKDNEGNCTTESDGTCSVRRFLFSQVQIVGAKYDYQRNDFKIKITDLYIYSHR